MSRIIVFGSSSFAEMVHFYLMRDSPHDVVAFTVHGDHIKETEFKGLPVTPFESVESLYPPDDYKMFIAVGAKKVNRVRAEIYHEAKNKGYNLITYVSSKCTHWGDTKIGDNCFIFEDNTIQPFVVIGNDVVLWSGNHIGHRVFIGDHTFVTSHVVISGHVHISPYCYLGVNSTIRDSVTIGESCVVGAGTLIMKSTGNREVFVGQRATPDSRFSDQLSL